VSDRELGLDVEAVSKRLDYPRRRTPGRSETFSPRRCRRSERIRWRVLRCARGRTGSAPGRRTRCPCGACHARQWHIEIRTGSPWPLGEAVHNYRPHAARSCAPPRYTRLWLDLGHWLEGGLSGPDTTVSACVACCLEHDSRSRPGL